MLPRGATEYIQCISYPVPVEGVVHTFIASGGKTNDRRRIDINKIMFYDNEPVDEEEQSEIDAESGIFDGASISDLLIRGDLNQALFADEEAVRHSYNDSLLSYNGKFAQLVGKFHANEEEIESILSELPTKETINEIQKEIYDFGEYQSYFHEHFEDLKAIIQELQGEFIQLRKEGTGGSVESAAFERDVNKLGADMGQAENKI